MLQQYFAKLPSSVLKINLNRLACAACIKARAHFCGFGNSNTTICKEFIIKLIGYGSCTHCNGFEHVAFTAAIISLSLIHI